MRNTPLLFKFLVGLIALLLLPSLLVNLGYMPFIDDEAIRALVALEMKLSGNFIAPTLNGEWYLNKPPLYNWFLHLFFAGFGSYANWVSRFATVVVLLGYCSTIYIYFSRHLTRSEALLAAAFFLTCGRVLLWDSQLGLIDMAFSWVTFTLFMVIYHRGVKQDYWTLFLVSYFLTAVGFMLKGLPSVVFQGLTLLAFFIWKRDWRGLISWAHVVGGLLFLSLIGLYYWAYSEYHELEVIFNRIFDESSKRTAVKYGVGKTIQHFFTFPFEMLYHFLPWTLLVLYLFRRTAWKQVRQSDFLTFLVLAFGVNIILYWTSVEVYPRYLLMHIPLLFGIFAALHHHHQQVRSWQWRSFLLVAYLGLLAFTAFSAAPLFWERGQQVAGYFPKSVLLLALFGFLHLCWWKLKAYRVWVLVAGLLVFRLGFNWFVLPDRYANDWGAHCMESTLEAARLTNPSHEVVLYKSTPIQPMNSFYFTRERNRILPRAKDGFAPGDTIIIDTDDYRGVELDTLAPIHLRFEKRTLYLGVIKSLK
jgi:4-amino-4-deoxy-L-arabinose transferase-like glycosyltransferase